MEFERLDDLLRELLVARAAASPPVVALLEARVVLEQREHAVGPARRRGHLVGEMQARYGRDMGEL